MVMRNVFLCVFFLVAVSLVPCEEVFFRVTEDTPAWSNDTNFDNRNSNNIILEIKKDTIVKGRNISIGRIEYKEKKYIVDVDMLVPANTVDLFDNSWITKPFASDTQWLLDYYLRVLLSENRDTFHEFEYKLMDYWYESDILGILSWYEYVDIYSCLDINQIGISVGGFHKKDFFITNIIKINNGYKITVIDCKYVENDKLLEYENTIAFPSDRHFFDILLIKDNDFMDMYLDTTENHLATFVRVNKDIIDELQSLLENNTCDLSKIKYFPKRADGSMVKYTPPALSNNENVFQVEDKMPESAIERKKIAPIDEAPPMPLLAWIIGGAVIVIGGGAAVFALKRKK